VVGGVIILDIAAIVLGIVLFFVWWAVRPGFFRGEVLNRDTPTLVPDDLGTPVGLFGLDEHAQTSDAGQGAAAGVGAAGEPAAGGTSPPGARAGRGSGSEPTAP
jgi:hypothetical protein